MPIPSHAYIDESKSGDYLLAAALLPSASIRTSQQKLKGLLLPGQERLHMTHEKDSRRRAILSTICSLDGLHVSMFRASLSSSRRTQKIARKDTIKAFLGHALNDKLKSVCLESDYTMDYPDRQVIAQYLKRHNAVDDLQYLHLPAKSEILLCIPDAVAWAWNRGGHWRDTVDPIVTEYRV